MLSRWQHSPGAGHHHPLHCPPHRPRRLLLPQDQESDRPKVGWYPGLNALRTPSTNDEDVGEVWHPEPGDNPYYDQMDYDYMDADDGGPKVTKPRKREEEKVKKEEEVKRKKEEEEGEEDYTLDYEENDYIEQ